MKTALLICFFLFVSIFFHSHSTIKKERWFQLKALIKNSTYVQRHHRHFCACCRNVQMLSKLFVYLSPFLFSILFIHPLDYLFSLLLLLHFSIISRCCFKCAFPLNVNSFLSSKIKVFYSGFLWIWRVSFEAVKFKLLSSSKSCGLQASVHAKKEGENYSNWNFFDAEETIISKLNSLDWVMTRE